MSKILIVDDRPINRELLTSLLGCTEHELCEAGDGAEALAIARAERPDLIITDLLMPTMDGFELLRQLRTDPALATTPVIFYTAKYHLKETEELEQLSNVYKLSKPAEPKVILNTVAQALSMPGASDPMPADFDRKHLSLVTDKFARAIDQIEVGQLRLEELGALGRHMAQESNLRRMLQLCCRGARTLFSAKYAVLVVLAEDRTTIEQLVTNGLDENETTAIREQTVDLSPLRRLLDVGRLLRLRPRPDEPEFAGLLKNAPAARSILFLPVASHAALILFEKLGAEEFSAEDEQLAATLNAQLTLCYENTKLREAIQHITAAGKAAPSGRRR